MLNPYPEMIIDEASGIEVPNQRHSDWVAGVNAERRRIVKLLSENYIPGTDLEVLIEDICNRGQ